MIRGGRMKKIIYLMCLIFVLSLLTSCSQNSKGNSQEEMKNKEEISLESENIIVEQRKYDVLQQLYMDIDVDGMDRDSLLNMLKEREIPFIRKGTSIYIGNSYEQLEGADEEYPLYDRIKIDTSSMAGEDNST